MLLFSNLKREFNAIQITEYKRHNSIVRTTNHSSVGRENHQTLSGNRIVGIVGDMRTILALTTRENNIPTIRYHTGDSQGRSRVGIECFTERDGVGRTGRDRIHNGCLQGHPYRRYQYKSQQQHHFLSRKARLRSCRLFKKGPFYVHNSNVFLFQRYYNYFIFK